ncbi:hypothetical protein BPA01_12800 [Brevibacillus parabrevis]|uniref:Uncharacterized protein n=1 Tax=Brevibacillus parabrevis TaxID=54914 RepID=A0A4Y3PAZ5_BREPA|nr:hypothetical protein BPA01_12800 [Brevibacillus parabrevis]
MRNLELYYQSSKKSSNKNGKQEKDKSWRRVCNNNADPLRRMDFVRHILKVAGGDIVGMELLPIWA